MSEAVTTGELASVSLVQLAVARLRFEILSDRDVEELYSVRDVLESHVVETALPLAPDADLTPMREALDAMAAGARRENRLAVADAHRAFHLALASLAGNRQLSLVYESV